MRLPKNLRFQGVGLIVIVLVVIGLILLFLYGGAKALADAPRFMRSVMAIGILTMTLLQLVKGLFRVRGHFQERVLREWIGRGLLCRKEFSQDAGGGPEKRSSNTSPEHNLVKNTPKERMLKAVGQVLNKLRELAVTNETVDLFNLPIEQLCGQITVAIEPLLDYPETDKKKTANELTQDEVHMELVVCALAGTGGWREAQKYDEQRSVYLSNKHTESADAEANFLAYRNRLAHHFQRNIDGLQIEVTQRWRTRLWVAALGVGTLMAGLTSLSLQGLDAQTFFTIVAGLSAAFVATVARDVVAIVEKLRR